MRTRSLREIEREYDMLMPLFGDVLKALLAAGVIDRTQLTQIACPVASMGALVKELMERERGRLSRN